MASGLKYFLTASDIYLTLRFRNILDPLMRGLTRGLGWLQGDGKTWVKTERMSKAWMSGKKENSTASGNWYGEAQRQSPEPELAMVEGSYWRVKANNIRLARWIQSLEGLACQEEDIYKEAKWKYL